MLCLGDNNELLETGLTKGGSLVQRVLIPERWERIIQLVESQGSATIEEIARRINISPATVRRDLTHIHERGLIERKRGGAVPGRHLHIGPTLAESVPSIRQKKYLSDVPLPVLLRIMM